MHPQKLRTMTLEAYLSTFQQNRLFGCFTSREGKRKKLLRIYSSFANKKVSFLKILNTNEKLHRQNFFVFAKKKNSPFLSRLVMENRKRSVSVCEKKGYPINQFWKLSHRTWTFGWLWRGEINDFTHMIHPQTQKVERIFFFANLCRPFRKPKMELWLTFFAIFLFVGLNGKGRACRWTGYWPF